MAADDELDEAIAAAAPRAPRDFGTAVEARLRRRERARGQGLAAGGAFVTLAAAALVLLLLRPTPPPAPRPWLVLAARGSTSDGGDGAPRPLVAGQLLVNGVHITVAPGGEARLTRPPATVILAADSAATVAEHELEIEWGSARLEGPETRVALNGTTVTTLGMSAAVGVEARRSEMNAIRPTNLVKPILATALVAVSVYQGAARVQPAGHSSPVELAENDRLLLDPRVPPRVTHETKPSEPLPLDRELTWEQDLDAAMRIPLGRIRRCYEMKLDANAKLTGHLLVRLHLLDGVVDSAEILPQGGNDHAPLTDQCILEAVQNVEVPMPIDGATTFVYPFTIADVPGGSSGDDEMRLLNPIF